LSALLNRARDKGKDYAAKAKELRKKLQSTEAKIERLYAAVADGTVSDTGLFRQSLERLEGEREEALKLIASPEQRKDVPKHLLSKDRLAKFAAAAAERLRAEDATLRKGYMRQLVERVEVDDREIRIIGSKSVLANGVLDSGSGGAAGVPRFEREWWARQDS